jgi:hypothetical protein
MELWTVQTLLDISRPSLTSAFLKRKAVSPKAVVDRRSSNNRVSLAGEKSKVLFDILSKKLHQVRALFVDEDLVDALQVPATLATALPATATALETLVISDILDTTSERLTLLLRIELPNLRHLVVDLTSALKHRWNVLPFSATLTYLEVSNNLPTVGDPDQDRPAVARFLGAFKELHGIRSLLLLEVLPDFASSLLALPDTPEIKLPHLQNMEITDAPSRMSRFFQIVQVPTKAEVAIQFDDEYRPESEGGDIERVVNKIFTSPQGQKEARREATSLLLNWKYIEISFTDHPDLMINWDRIDYPVHQLLKVLGDNIGLSTLTSLVFEERCPDIRVDDSDETAVWRRFIGQLPHLQALTLYQTSLFDLLEAFEAQDDADVYPTYFPSLSTLTLIDLDLGDEEYDDIDMGQITLRLIKALKQRLHLGYPLSRLYIEQCNSFREEHFAMVTSRVPSLRVKWDRYRQPRKAWEDRCEVCQGASCY